MSMQHQNLTFPPASVKSAAAYVLNSEKSQTIAERLQQFMQEAKPFLKYRYSIRRLAEDIEVQAYQLSAYLNQEKHVRFNDYLNQFRIQHCKDLIQNQQVNDLNMKGLALICGFQNRNTLTCAFKKFTGFTPSHFAKYIRSLG
jgi:YesN/AraC family two-component response regulator